MTRARARRFEAGTLPGGESKCATACDGKPDPIQTREIPQVSEIRARSHNDGARIRRIPGPVGLVWKVVEP